MKNLHMEKNEQLTTLFKKFFLMETLYKIEILSQLVIHKNNERKHS